MTVSEYIRRHPRTILTRNLKRYFGSASRKQIHLTSGLQAPTNPNSNLGKMLRKVGWGKSDFIIGGRAGKNANDGYTFAVFRK